MNAEIKVLAMTAASIGFFHTLFGPDHYVPFIVMAKTRRWSYLKTILVTVLCGIGHVGSSVVLGLLGVALGIAVEKLEIFESIRGDWAAWALIAFGLAYFIYGIRQAIINQPHAHNHFHSDGHPHDHEHNHHGEHAHLHDLKGIAHPVTWSLFVIFVFGPCEPLIPILMYPAAKHSLLGMAAVTIVFSLFTVGTMLSIVLMGTFGVKLLSFKRIEKFSHAIAGFTIFLCGCAIKFLGL
ncbi:MAG: sulfite exporter TauE/SafE family protein [Candidatus Omnitrophica bacterium]|nr:sulfite exporter TauE/SafE family protein [Candidatus Omnitrophota bacterium]